MQDGTEVAEEEKGGGDGGGLVRGNLQPASRHA